MSVLDTLKAASVARRTVVLILDSSLQAEWDAVQASLDNAAAEDERSGSVADPFPQTRQALKRMEEIREKVAASEVTFTFVQIPWQARVALQADHPPRKGNLIDQARGYNIETFVPALVKESCESVTDAGGDTTTDVPDEVWTDLFGRLNMKAVTRLYEGAAGVNDQETQVPTSARSLLESQAFGASLAQPEPGTSPRSGSKAGSRRGSAKSSATKKAGSSAS